MKQRTRVKLLPADTLRKRIGADGTEETLFPTLIGGVKGKNKIMARTKDGILVRVPYQESGYMDLPALKKKMQQQK